MSLDKLLREKHGAEMPYSLSELRNLSDLELLSNFKAVKKIIDRRIEDRNRELDPKIIRQHQDFINEMWAYLEALEKELKDKHINLKDIGLQD